MNTAEKDGAFQEGKQAGAEQAKKCLLERIEYLKLESEATGGYFQQTDNLDYAIKELENVLSILNGLKEER